MQFVVAFVNLVASSVLLVCEYAKLPRVLDAVIVAEMAHRLSGS